MDRRTFIGASDVPVILGLSPYKTPLQLWAFKCGEVDPDEQTEAMEWGHRLERVISDKFAEHNGVKLMAFKKRYVHPSMPYFSCELDNIIVGSEELVEVKSVNAHQWKNWESPDNIPDYIVVQVMAQLGLSKRRVGHIACLCGGQKFFQKRIDFDPELFRTIESRVKEFWDMVQTNTPPHVEPDDNSFMIKLFPKAGTQIEQATSDLVTAIAQLQLTKAEIIALEKIKDELEAGIKAVIGDNVGVETPEYIAKWINVKGSTFTVTKADSRQLRIIKKKG